MRSNKKIDILISTKNRRDDLLTTITKIAPLLSDAVGCVVYDDGSSDGTSNLIKNNFPNIKLLKNDSSRGYIFCRNKMLNDTQADFAISLDDDAHFITNGPIKIIDNYFEEHAGCGLIATRIFWGKEILENTTSSETAQSVKSYVGCGHVWRMKAWKDIPDYPEWYEFYGEENFASLQLFKKNWEIHYVPQLLVQHRVDLKSRTEINNDFAFRHRRSLRADWYNYTLFFPLRKIPGKLAFSIWMQFKNKIFKGNLRVISPLLLAIFDLLISIPKIISNRKALTSEEYTNYLKLKEAKIFWKPEK